MKKFTSDSTKEAETDNMSSEQIDNILTEIFSRRGHEHPRPQTVPKAYGAPKNRRYLPTPKPAPPPLRLYEQEENGEGSKDWEEMKDEDQWQGGEEQEWDGGEGPSAPWPQEGEEVEREEQWDEEDWQQDEGRGGQNEQWPGEEEENQEEYGPVRAPTLAPMRGRPYGGHTTYVPLSAGRIIPQGMQSGHATPLTHPQIVKNPPSGATADGASSYDAVSASD